MSWHIEVVGTQEEVCEAIDLNAKASSGMPSTVSDALKEAVRATKPGIRQLVYVKSNGHRPLEYGSANEATEVKLISTVHMWRPATS